MTVEEYFGAERIDYDDVEVQADTSTYWANAVKFVSEKWNDAIDNLSPKQIDWLSKIRDDIIENRCRR